MHVYATCVVKSVSSIDMMLKLFRKCFGKNFSHYLGKLVDGTEKSKKSKQITYLTPFETVQIFPFEINLSLHKKMKFPLSVSRVNVTKSAGD